MYDSLLGKPIVFQSNHAALWSKMLKVLNLVCMITYNFAPT